MRASGRARLDKLEAARVHALRRRERRAQALIDARVAADAKRELAHLAKAAQAQAQAQDA